MSDAALVTEARRWLGTPYVHQASCPGAGADCLGLIRGLWRARFGTEAPVPPCYAPDWALRSGGRDLLAGLAAHLCAVPTGAPCEPGQVLAFRLRARGPAVHLGVLSAAGAAPRFIHACSRHGVIDSALGAAWARRVQARFRFPPAPLQR